MTEEMPFDLRSLGDVESPEVVRSALRRFRRRTLRTVLAVLAVGALAATIVVAVRRDPLAIDRAIVNAPGIDISASYQSGGVTLALVRVADLRYQAGFRFVVIAPEVRGMEPFVDIQVAGLGQGKETRTDGSILNVWSGFDVPADGRFEVIYKQVPKCEKKEDLGGGIFTCTKFETGPVDSPGADPFGDIEVARFQIDLRALGVPERIWLKGGSR